MDCLFCKITTNEIPANIVYEDDLILVFDDINPQAPVHKLLIPRQHIATLNDLTPEHNGLVGHLIETAAQIAKTVGVAEPGYRLTFNCNPQGGQEVYHIHAHLLAGRKMTWPPG